MTQQRLAKPSTSQKVQILFAGNDVVGRQLAQRLGSLRRDRLVLHVKEISLGQVLQPVLPRVGNELMKISRRINISEVIVKKGPIVLTTDLLAPRHNDSFV